MCFLLHYYVLPFYIKKTWLENIRRAEVKMNKRQKKMLKLLLVNEDTIQILSLSQQLECSEKTVRNDLDRLEEIFEVDPKVQVIRKTGQGIKLETSKEYRMELLQQLLSNDTKTTEDRLVEMAHQFLTSNTAIPLQRFADRYYVPKTAVKKDLQMIEAWLRRFELELVSKPRLGNIIYGSELQKRNALAHLSELLPSVAVEKNYVLDLFLPYEIDITKKALLEMQRKFSIIFTEEALQSLLIHTLIMVKRTRQKSTISVEESEKAETVKRKEYEYACWFFQQLASSFQLSFPKAEQVYFTWHLISAGRIEEAAKVIKFDKDTLSIVEMTIQRMSKLTLLPFNDDPILADGLTLHLNSVVNRVKYGLSITNPLLTNIKKIYPYMFSMVILTLEEVNKNYNLEVIEDEAAYLVLHFQASVERMENKRGHKNKVLIICHMGIGMSRLLEAKIIQQYQDIEVLACISKAETEEYVKQHQVDFIISTVSLDYEALSVEHLVISPLFTREDKVLINQLIEKRGQEQAVSLKSGDMSQFFNPNLLFFDVTKEHRYEVVEMLATELLNKGYATREYIHSAVNRERKSATAIGGGIAIPHGDPSMVQKSAIAVAIMREPIEWENEQVSLVFLLAIANQDHADIRAAIGSIASLSESPLNVHELTMVQNYNDFIKVLEKNSIK